MAGKVERAGIVVTGGKGQPDMYIYISMYIHTHTHIYIHIYMYIHIYIYTYTYRVNPGNAPVMQRTHILFPALTPSLFHTHTHIYVYVYMYMYTYIYTYLRKYTHTYMYKGLTLRCICTGGRSAPVVQRANVLFPPETGPNESTYII